MLTTVCYSYSYIGYHVLIEGGGIPQESEGHAFYSLWRLSLEQDTKPLIADDGALYVSYHNQCMNV